MIEYHNIKLFFQTFTLQTGLKNVLWLKKLEILFRGLMLLVILMVKKLMEHFSKNEIIRNAEKSKFTYNDWGIAFNGKVFCIFWC